MPALEYDVPDMQAAAHLRQRDAGRAMNDIQQFRFRMGLLLFRRAALYLRLNPFQEGCCDPRPMPCACSTETVFVDCLQYAGNAARYKKERQTNAGRGAAQRGARLFFAVSVAFSNSLPYNEKDSAGCETMDYEPVKSVIRTC